MSGRLAEILEQQPCVILDHGLATDCEARGADISNPLWSASLLLPKSGRKLIYDVHTNALEAGADVITTASYQATIPGLKTYAGLSEAEAEQILLRSLEVAAEARCDFWSRWTADHGNQARAYPVIAASIGCYGAYLADGSEYRGDYTLSPAQLADFHRSKYRTLAKKAEVIAFETIPCRTEAEAISMLLMSHPPPPGTEVWVTFTCRSDTAVASGELLADCIAVLADHPHVFALGMNCCPPECVTGLLKVARATTIKPLVCYPNSGERWNDAKRQYEGPPTNLAGLAPDWLAAGARLIGGCCRTQPPDITAIRKQMLKR